MPRPRVTRTRGMKHKQALGNPLLVARICSFVSLHDLLHFRLINKIFYREATKCLRSQHEPITFDLPVHSNMLELESFLECMRARFDPDLNPFPFSSFRWYLYNSDEHLKIFLKSIGEHIRYFELLEPEPESWAPIDRSDRAKYKLEFIFFYARNIENFKFLTTFPIHLDPREVTLLPTAFPHLRRIHIDYFEDTNELPPSKGSVPLLHYLVTRAESLDHVHIPRILKRSTHNADTIRAIRVILERNQGQGRLPTLSLSETKIIQPSTLPALRELTGMGFEFREFFVDLSNEKFERRFDEQGADDILDGVAWLATQSSRVTTLNVSMDHLEPIRNFSFRLPALPKLTELVLTYWDSSLNTVCSIQPLTSNHFPVLRKVTLWYYRDIYGIFNHCSLPSVQELHVIDPLTPLTSPWHTIFPNLTAIYFEHNCYTESSTSESPCEEQVTNVGFLLKRFPRITTLSLALGEEDYWDILTGGARRPRSTHALHLGKMKQVARQPLKPDDDGVYRTASLRNLRALTSLVFCPGNRGNLDAIVFMTRAGVLGPLQMIDLQGLYEINFNIEVEDGGEYITQLENVHSEVYWDRF